MQLIKRLKHDAIKMTDARIGWDIFRCGDYSVADSMAGEGYMNPQAIKSKIRIGYTVIFAVNLGPIKFLKRLFIG